MNFAALVEEGVVDERDLGLFGFVESAEDAWAAIERHYAEAAPAAAPGA